MLRGLSRLDPAGGAGLSWGGLHTTPTVADGIALTRQLGWRGQGGT
jgi:hypothetical protein